MTHQKPAFDPSTLKAGDTAYMLDGRGEGVTRRTVQKVTATQVVIEQGVRGAPPRRFDIKSGIEVDGSLPKWKRASLVTEERWIARQKAKRQERRVLEIRHLMREQAQNSLSSLGDTIAEIQRLRDEYNAEAGEAQI